MGSNGAADWLDAGYTCDREGKMLTQTHSGALAAGSGYGRNEVPGEILTYAFD